ncbi:methionine adenosyltransferase [Patescibacteria group bacterium]|nr:methionine adenosyltransferase [Patescibacteria group bacterium]
MKKYLTSESVTEGHPDKLADQISDAILDVYLRKDFKSRVACETLITKDNIIVAGEITSSAQVDIEQIVKKVVNNVGYNNPDYGFDINNCEIRVFIQKQSPDISQGVNAIKLTAIGAGDQGLMYGYATNETDEYMPLPIVLAHKLTKQLMLIRKSKKLAYLRPDGKSQVTVEYKNNKPSKINNIVVAAQHNPKIDINQLRADIIKNVIQPVIPQKMFTSNIKYFINTTGRFVFGGPAADTGLTGRKIIIDTYGGAGRHGGGCFSGKDPSKVDRSASYGARWVAKNIVAAGLADKIEIQLAYSIGKAQPLSINIDTFNTAKLADEKIIKIINKVFDLRPGMLIKELDLLRPIYQPTAKYGHFGRDDLDLPWEKLNKLNSINSLLSR